MSTKSLLLTTLFFLLLASTHAQWLIGAQGGITYNTLLTNVTNHPSIIYQGDNGWTGSIPVWYRWPSGLPANGELSLLQKNYKMLDTIDSYYGQNRLTQNNYLQLNLGIGYTHTFLKKIFIAASVGIYAGYWTNGFIEGDLPSFFSADTTRYTYTYKQDYPFDSRRDQRWEWGWHLGGNGGYCLPKGFIATLGVRFFQSLQDQQKSYMLDQVPRYNKTWAFSLGVLKSFGKK